MKFHTGSFFLGAAAGAALLGRRMRPLLLELATTAYRIADAIAARVAMKCEDMEDLMAEARARARRHPEAAPTEAPERVNAKTKVPEAAPQPAGGRRERANPRA
jgi:hypothetical protein